MLYLLLSDIHASDRPPSSCTETYLDDLLGLLRQTVSLARARKVVAVIWAGDVFHSKAPSRVSHRLVQLLIDIIRAYPCPVFIVPGNHDIRNDRLDSITETQPLGVLFRAGAIRLEGWGGYDAHRQYNIYGVPWQQDWAALSAALSPYRHPSSARQPSLVVAHAPLYPPGRELQFEYYPAEDWARYMGGQGYCFYGHVHEPHGVWSIDTSQPGLRVQDAIGPVTVGSFSGSVTFCNNGALSRGSLHEYNLTRDVGCTLWDDETGEFEFVPLDAKPAEQVFRLAEAEQATDMHGRLDQFLEDIGRVQLGVVTAESVLEYARTLDNLQPGDIGLIEELLAYAAEAREK